MKYFKRMVNQLLLLITCCFWAFPLVSQVFPGDASNNGEVDNVDLLYIGYAYGEVGPARLEVGVEFAEQAIILPWDQNFPIGLNYAYADTDGNGLIDIVDLLTVFINYGETTGIVTPVEYPVGTLGVDPVLDLHSDAIPNQLVPGNTVQIPITLGSEEAPVENINGIAFSIHYNQEIVSFISLELNAPWMSPVDAGALFHFQNFPIVEDGVLDVAMTRFGQEPISGYGEIGVLTIVIEDDLLDLLPDQNDSLEVVVEIDEIFMLNGNFETVPVVADSVTMMLYHPNAITRTKEPAILNTLVVAPNPASGTLYIDAPITINGISVLNMLGEELLFMDGLNDRKVSLETSQLPTGMAFVQVYTNTGMAVRKILVTK